MGTIGKIKDGNNNTHLVASTAYGTCPTAAGTAAKVATIQDSQAFTLMTGVTVHIKFSNTNTVANPTLNVNSTGAIAIKMYGTTAIGTATTTSWTAGAIVSLTYDGTNWLVNDYRQGNSNYTTHLYAGDGTAANKVTTNGNTKLTVTDNSTVRNAVTLKGTGGTTVTSDANGVVTINSTDSDTKYTAGTGLALASNQFSVKTGYTTSGNNRAVQADTNGNLYVVQKDTDTNNRRAFYGTCATAAATAAKEVTLSNTAGWEFVPGVVVGVKFTYTNSAQNPTLNVNGTGAKSVWYAQAALTTGNLNKAGYANRYQFYMYDGTYWVWINWGSDDNSNTYDRTYLSNSGYKAGSTAIVAANIITANSSGLYQHLKSGAAFDITMPILYASSAAAANAANNDGYVIIPFTITTTQSMTLTPYKAIYIKGQLSGSTFTPVSTTPLTQTIPTSADGYEYMLLGYATTATVAYLLPEHPIYAYTGGAFTRIGGRGITNVTRSGTTFTATREDGSTFTFTQQDNNTKYTATTESIGSASAGTAIAADDITAWTTNTPTAVTAKTVVTGGTTTDVPNISKKTVVTGVTKKTVVTSASGATATYDGGILTITDGSFGTGDSVTVTTGDSVTVGTAIKAYTSLTTGDSVSVTAGKAASLSYTARSIPNISVTSKAVVTEISEA